MSVFKTLRIQRELLSDKVADLLRRMILSGDLPPGTHLVEDEVASQLGTSRAPLREALGLLSREGLVVSQPGRGTFVKGFTAQSIRDLFALRTVLEAFAAELAAARIKPQEAERLRLLLKEMEDIVVEGDGSDYADVDMEIHRVIWRISGNERLVDMLESLAAPVIVFIKVNAEHYRDWPEVVHLHHQLIEAIASSDGELAARTMRDHQANALAKALAALKVQAGVPKADEAEDSQRR